ncbi:heavy-metal-associated domain-containing protein [Flavobacterium selenitireducens]|uniref:heavy-metal-associated domain-containing protein n=1 Tax=Flavobacterium selenitireducens TaxID=2722704 RepID=UPI00168BA57E|nr:cation transporter [Flavobacterium selenitireducens]MBD3581900.1 heavy-metal-associated domain-containing protein [Flavobacterium selenitireducens]
MKNAIKFIAFVGLMLAGSSSVAQMSKKNEKVVIKTNIYCDHCKECPSCGKSLQSNLLKMKGVKMYELDDKKMTLTVYYNGQKTNADAIRRSISEMGYDADDIKALPEAYEKLDDCCKKA